jgi:hypothetical protein
MGDNFQYNNSNYSGNVPSKGIGKYIILGFVLVILVAGFIGYFMLKGNSVNPPINDLANITLSSGSLKIVAPTNGICLGAYNWGRDGVKEFEIALGKKVALIGEGPCGTPENIVEDYGNVSCAQEVYGKGYVGGFEFRCGNFANYQQEYIDGKFDACLTKVAQNIKLLNRPLFWKYPREPSIQIRGGYGPTGTQNREESMDDYGQFGCTDSSNEMCLDGPERFRAAQRHIHDLVEGVCKDCVTWVALAPIYLVSGQDMIKEYRLYSPGDDYTDWHAVDYYPIASTNAGISEELNLSIELFSNRSSPFNQWYDYAMQLNSTKPVMIVEFGPIGVGFSDSSIWFNDFFKSLKEPRYKNIKAFMYWQFLDNSNIRINAGTPIGNLWKAEIAANPNFWVSDVVTAGGKTISGVGGGIVGKTDAGTGTGETPNSEQSTTTCFNTCREEGNTIDYCNSHC